MYNNECPAYENTQMKYFTLGELAFESLMSDLKQAEKFILFSFFTIADGEIWNAISDIHIFSNIVLVKLRVVRRFRQRLHIIILRLL